MLQRREDNSKVRFNNAVFLQLMGAGYSIWQLSDAPNAKKLLDYSILDLKKLCALNRAAYGLPGLPIFETDSNVSLGNYKVVPFDNGVEHSGFMFLSNEKVIIAIHGTASAFDIEEDLDFLSNTREFLSGMGRAHAGSCDYLKRVYPKIIKTIAQYQNAKILCTGHSLGGGVAILLAATLNQHLPNNEVSCVAFASPGVFDATGARLYNNQLRDKTLRIVEKDFDPIPDLGLDGMDFQNVGFQLDLTVSLRQSLPHRLDGYAIGLDNLTDLQFVYQALKVTPSSSSTALWWMYSSLSSAYNTAISYIPNFPSFWLTRTTSKTQQLQR
jgi:pimeloyl-ACP methyl ester carboxylesterase